MLNYKIDIPDTGKNKNNSLRSSNVLIELTLKS